MEVITSVGCGVLLFICFIIGYREGIRLGMRSAKGIEPPALRTPVEVVKEHIEQKKAEIIADKEAEAFDAFMNHDGYTDKERIWLRGEKN